MENPPQTTNERALPFLDHLEELRFRLFRIIVSFIVFTALAYFFKEEIFKALVEPLAKLDVRFIHTKVYDKFIAYLKISLYSGIVLSFPVIIFQLSKFVVPALYPNEKRWFYGGLAFVMLFFFLGAFVSYRYITPVSLKFLIEFGNEEKKDEKVNVKNKKNDDVYEKRLKNIDQKLEKLDSEIQSGIAALPKNKPEMIRMAGMLKAYGEVIKDMSILYKELRPGDPPPPKSDKKADKERKIESYLNISDYFDWIIFFVFIIGVIFQLPLIISILAKLGMVDDRTLGRIRPYALIVILVLSALITPPDVLSQLMIGLPVYLLYEISILMAKIIRIKQEKKSGEEAS
ncbi:MAG: twin-arginine translocase subunit TatC [Spirochaetota bacterium]|nr:twin-arginine translocase subunit TatC [Spirochaetota bacterium]